MKEQFFKLILVTNKKNIPLNSYLDFIYLCAKSGITSVQLREKNLGFNELFAFGKQLQQILSPLSIPLIVNDDVALALGLNATGVHLGQSDGSVLATRQKLGNNKIIGLTIDSLEQLRVANTLPIDYIGIGVIFPTHNKLNNTTIWGLNGLKKIARLTKHRIIAIGGINETNADAVMKTGINGIAAIGAFHDSLDPQTATKNLRNIVEKVNHD